MDTQYLILFMLFILWVYFLELSLNRKEKGYTYLQFVLSFPLMAFLGNDAYLHGFIFGWVFIFVIGLSSLYVLSSNLDDLKKVK